MLGVEYGVQYFFHFIYNLCAVPSKLAIGSLADTFIRQILFSYLLFHALIPASNIKLGEAPVRDPCL